MSQEDPQAAAIAQEQKIVDGLFAYVDRERAEVEEKIRQVLLHRPDADDPRGLVERETAYGTYGDRLVQLSAAEVGLCFGRIDVEEHGEWEPENPVPGHPTVDRRYIGRIGLSDKKDDYRTLLVDWRADAARPFYTATTAHPDDVLVRRHLRTSGRTVTKVADEVLSGQTEDHQVARTGAGDESVLLDALNAARTGHMTDIVETIQREQDDIIRDSYRGVTVVEGGPGTGKTAVALHRAAYLLYTWRDILGPTGVLVIGPNETFIDYISQVLPTLGEGGVVLTTLGGLYPGVTATRQESDLVREVKGSPDMVDILHRAVQAYEKVPDAPLEVRVSGVMLTIPPKTIRDARTRARRTRRSHNEALPAFRDRLVDNVTDLLAAAIGEDPLGGHSNLLSPGDLAALREDVDSDEAVSDLVEKYWPHLEPTEVLHEFLTDAQAIAQAAAEYDEQTQRALLRDPGVEDFSVSDVALLDELAEFIGVLDPEQARQAEREKWLAHIAEAQDALDILTGSASQDVDDGFDPEILMAYDVIDAEQLAERHRERDTRTTAQRAQEDRLWAYGHVIVDEAQELSAMDWRMVMRRSPSRWMTLVGDTAQTGSPAGVDQWGEALDPFVKQRWHHHQLTINYRTPAPIARLANQLLEDVAPGRKPDRAIRNSERIPSFVAVDEVGSDGWLAQLQSVLDQAVDRIGDEGRSLAVIYAPTHEGVIRRVQDAVDTHGLAVSWLTTGQAKGLEFDEVVVVEPAEIVDSTIQGYQDLFVALTRATQGLTIVHHGDPIVSPE